MAEADEVRDRLIEALDDALLAEGFAVTDPMLDRMADALAGVVVLADDVAELVREAWAVGYNEGVADEATSQDWTGGEVSPARVNPYADPPAPRGDAEGSA